MLTAKEKLNALRRALRNWPKMPDPAVLRELPGTLADLDVGKAIQASHGTKMVPPVAECERGAGYWDRITKGEWRQFADALDT